MGEKVAILMSGGMDSSALCAWLRPQVAIYIDYGQLCAEAEAIAAAQVCTELKIDLQKISLPCRNLGSGDLAGCPASHCAPASDWWPFRNQLLVTAASMLAVSIGVQHLMLGTVKTDGSHADGTPRFMNAMSALLGLQEGGLKLSAPAIDLTTAELVRRSGISQSILCWAHSCHRSNFACGLCRGCNKHREVMSELGYGPH